LEEAVVNVAHEFNRGWTRVTGDAALELRGASNDRLPPLEFIFIFDLKAVSMS
jgi:hypothetical protein